jgi:hypothetical protein
MFMAARFVFRIAAKAFTVKGRKASASRQFV